LNQTVAVSLRPSRTLALVLTAIAAAALAGAWVSLPAAALPLVASGIALAWASHVAHALQRGRAALHALVLDADGGARCLDGSGQWHEAEILRGSYVSAWLIVVILGGGGRRRRALVLLPDAAAGDELRRLRVWLRWRLAQA